ncbi:MAG: glutamate 5-kinase [Sphingomonadales bacterium]|jgi:glutamate 5-kinase
MDAGVNNQHITKLLKHKGKAKRIVIKLGSALLVDEGGELRTEWLSSFCADIAELKQEGREVIIISSGAGALGRLPLGFDSKPKSLSAAQAAAAVGQISLAGAWQSTLAEHDLMAALLLLTLSDLEGRRTYLNARETLKRLLSLSAVPVVNENDSTATEEIRFGDNDRLAARVTQMLGADLLILLSDIDGLYDKDPKRFDDAKFISDIRRLTPELEAMAGEADSTGVGSGGMVTKLAAARIAADAGAAMIITYGHIDHPIRRLKEGARASLFHKNRARPEARKAWLAGRLHLTGDVIIDDGALKALRKGRSLLPSGISAIKGEFDRGDAVAVCNEDGDIIARGITAYGFEEAKQIIGCQSRDIANLLGYDRGEVFIHRNDMVLENYV